ncbi:MAG: 5-formyltetrahydrofolate cyclo-ligase [Phascolarctobacterium sp.]|nr:5-formyltetrahydrofolate cyclo-ligase [Phascolarctobacterium sp.]
MLKEKNNSKNEIRARLKLARKTLATDYVKEASNAICQNILASKIYDDSEVILAYLAFGKEVNCDELIRKALAVGKTVCIPFIIDKENFVSAKLESLDNLSLDRYGIRTVAEPFIEIPQAEIDLILVPGLAFGEDGSRMGMGAGYYDRFLGKTQAITLGLAYKKLMQPSLPMDEHDVFMQYIVNEEKINN